MVTDGPGVAVAVLLTPQGLNAVAAGATGTIIRLIRQARGWNQQELADRAGYSQATISRLERGMSRAVRDTAVLTDIAHTLDVPPAVLGVASDPEHRPILDNVDRRGFLGGAAGLAVTVLLPPAVMSPGRIDADDVTQCWSALRRLFEMDDSHGGAATYQVAEEMARRLADAVRRGTYTSSVGRELQNVTAATMEHAGWLAYDARLPHKARYWWLETCHLTDLAGVPDARITALASMALQASDTPGGGQETVYLARAARATAGDGAIPILLLLLAAREAIGHAQAGDRNAAMSAFGRSRELLDQGRRGDEPFWLDFWGPADLAWHEISAALATGQGALAESAARRALASVDAETFPRNHVLYASDLGLILIRRGQLDEAIAVTSGAIQRITTARGSGRIVARLNRTIDLLGQQNHPPAKIFATAARRLLLASP
ncbi:MAG TPA: helix-turn-helix transcriptional regulator [Pseudonocardiaceae bacterium]|nr:helix-turn-helix transcriptional regulator [Pseudonocardiaceae bacterium]